MTTLILALPCKGMLTQDMEFSIKVAQNITVQKGFCAYVPCSFTTPRWFMSKAGPLYVYWLKDADKTHSWISPGYWLPGKLVFTTNKNQKLNKTHFMITGDPKKGDCSFSITNIGPEDVGWYYLRIEKGQGYSYLSFHKQIHAQPQIFLTDLKKPKIVMSSEVIWGKPATFRCFVPGVCPGREPQIDWTTEFSHTKYFWITKESDWSSTYGADISFTPSLADEGKVLTCRVKYQGLKKAVHETTRLSLGYSPETTATMGTTTCQHEKKEHLCFCSIHSWPPSKIDWHVDGKLIDGATGSGGMQVFSWVEGNKVTSTLHWKGNLDDEKGPFITCTGSNAFGLVTIKVHSGLNATGAADEKVKLSTGKVSGFVVGVIAVLACAGGVLYACIVFRQRVNNVPVT